MRQPTRLGREQFLVESLENRMLLSTGLAVTYNSGGISTLSYNGQTLINVPQYGSGNAYQVNRYYTLNADGTYTAVYGGTNFTSNWNASTLTLKYTYSFGSIAVQFVQPSDSRLNMIFTVTNNANSGVTLGGVDIYPAAIHFPNPIPVSYYVGTAPMWSPMVDTTLDGPNIIPANYQSGTMAFVNDSDPTKPIYTSLFTLDNTTGENYYMFVGTGPKDNLSSSLPVFYRNTAPGQTDTFEESMRFGPANTDPYSLAPDVEQAYNAAFPPLPVWPDRRAIASLHLTSPPTHVNNPEGWFNNSSSIDTTTQSGLNSFGQQLLQYAQSSLTVMKTDNAQGMIVWDIEGQEWPQATTYIGDPALAFDTRIEQGVTLSNGTVTTPMGYNYLGGGPLIDQFFAIFRNAGFRTGLTIRPTEIEFSANGTPSQVTADEISELAAKITYAYDRWGCTLFYVDSNSGYDRDALRAVQKMFPNVLLIPEHSTTATYGASAPYGQLLTYNFTGTPSYVYDTYPERFQRDLPRRRETMAIPVSRIITRADRVKQLVANGDIILFRGWFNDAYNTTMVQIYDQAAAVPPTPTGLNAAVTTNSIKLTWNAVTGAGVFSSGVYNVMRATSATGPYTTIGYGIFGPSYTDTTTKGNTKYYYEVNAVDGAGASTNSSSVIATITATAVNGDQDSSNEADTIRVVRSGSNIDIYRNNTTTPAYQFTYATAPDISISAAGGNDTIIIDYTGGNPIPAAGLSIDGGTGTNLISVLGTGGGNADTVALAAGSVAVNGGAFTYSNAETLALTLGAGNDTLTTTGTNPVSAAFNLSLTASPLP